MWPQRSENLCSRAWGQQGVGEGWGEVWGVGWQEMWQWVEALSLPHIYFLLLLQLQPTAKAEAAPSYDIP